MKLFTDGKGKIWKDRLKDHLIDSIDSDGFEDEPYYNDCNSITERITFCYGRFLSEYQWRVDQDGHFTAVRDWLQGLALPVEFYNYRIIEMYEQLFKCQITDENLLDELVEDYWNRLTMALLALFRSKGFRQ